MVDDGDLKNHTREGNNIEKISLNEINQRLSAKQNEWKPKKQLNRWRRHFVRRI